MADEQRDEEHEPDASEPEEDAPAGESEGEGLEPESVDPTWFDMASTTTCPVCGAAGAMMLGDGTFCPTCGEVTTPRDRPS
jgi:hypothetical protein